MRLRWLTTFIAVAEEEHFGRAAGRLNLAQPAVSKHVAELEAAMGVRLFERLPRGVRLSAPGRVMLVEAKRIAAATEAAKHRVRAASKGLHGTLRVGLVDAMSWHPVVLGALAQFRTAAPDVALEIEIASSLEQVDKLRDGSLDLGFIFNRATIAADLQGEIVSRHEVRLAVPVGHRLADRTSVKCLDFKDEAFVAFARATSPIFFDRLTAELRRHDISPEIVQTGTNEAAVLGLVAAGVGVALVNDALEHRRPAGLTLIPIDDLSVPLEHELTWRADDNSPLIARFCTVAVPRPEPALLAEPHFETGRSAFSPQPR